MIDYDRYLGRVYQTTTGRRGYTLTATVTVVSFTDDDHVMLHAHEHPARLRVPVAAFLACVNSGAFIEAAAGPVVHDHKTPVFTVVLGG
jgi:hypothetical protein